MHNSPVKLLLPTGCFVKLKATLERDKLQPKQVRSSGIAAAVANLQFALSPYKVSRGCVEYVRLSQNFFWGEKKNPIQ